MLSSTVNAALTWLLMIKSNRVESIQIPLLTASEIALVELEGNSMVCDAVDTRTPLKSQFQLFTPLPPGCVN